MIYTRTGDGGTTSLVGGSRVDKDDARVEAYGTVDELNSYLGLLAATIEVSQPDEYVQLKQAQNHLFSVQTLLATEDEALYARMPQISTAIIDEMEHQIDALNAKLPALRSFVIAGGSREAALCHVCRTVCRRAERRVVTLSHQAPVAPEIMRYLNRLSDYLFVLSRWLLVANHIEEDTYTF